MSFAIAEVNSSPFWIICALSMHLSISMYEISFIINFTVLVKYRYNPLHRKAMIASVLDVIANISRQRTVIATSPILELTVPQLLTGVISMSAHAQLAVSPPVHIPFSQAVSAGSDR